MQLSTYLYVLFWIRTYIRYIHLSIVKGIIQWLIIFISCNLFLKINQRWLCNVRHHFYIFLYCMIIFYRYKTILSMKNLPYTWHSVLNMKQLKASLTQSWTNGPIEKVTKQLKYKFVWNDSIFLRHFKMVIYLLASQHVDNRTWHCRLT